MNLQGNIEEIREPVEKLFTDFPDAVIHVEKSDDKGYEICGRDGSYFIRYCRKNDCFRGMAVLADKIRKNEKTFVFSETNRFERCGVMIDVSRNAVLKVETVKDVIRRMAKMGLNELMLYTEDTYKLENYPYFGYMRGAYTKDELREIASYGDTFGIEVVPCIQTLAHLKKALQWSYAGDLRDTEDILLADEEKTYAFIEEMIKTARECYQTDRIHIGMDEAARLGNGVYKKKHGETDQMDIFTKHLARVAGIAGKYGFKPMMWSDMFFRMYSPEGEYYTYEARFPDDLSERLPPNISMVYWDYYYGNPKVIDAMLAEHRALKREIIFAGGIWTWGGLSVNYAKTFYTARTQLSCCIDHGIRHVFAAMWGDDGGENSIYTALLGMQLYAEYNYAENPDDNQIATMFKVCTGYDADAFKALSLDSFPEEESRLAMASKQVFYNDVLLGLFDKNFRLYDYRVHFAKALEKLEGTGKQGDLEYLFDYGRLLAKILAAKSDMGIRLTDAYVGHDRKKLAALTEELAVLESDCEKLHETAAEIWYRNNKPFGFEVFEMRLAGVKARVKRARARVKAYLNGETPTLPELEEERLYYARSGKGDSPFLWEYSFSRISSASH